MRFDNASYCDVCQQVVSDKSRPARSTTNFHISGTKFRGMLDAGEDVPETFMRPEVYDYLKSGTDKFY